MTVARTVASNMRRRIATTVTIASAPRIGAMRVVTMPTMLTSSTANARTAARYSIRGAPVTTAEVVVEKASRPSHELTVALAALSIGPGLRGPCLR